MEFNSPYLIQHKPEIPFRALLASVCLVLSLKSPAQISETDTGAYRLSSSVSGLVQTGNVSLLNLRAKFDFGLPLGDSALYFKTQNNYLYQEFSRFKADEDVYSQNFIYYKAHRRLYPYLISFLATNYRRGIRFRHFSGAGLSIKVAQHKNIQFKVSANLLYEENHFSGTSFNQENFSGNAFISTWRSSFYGELGLHFGSFHGHAVYWIMPSLKDAGLLRQQLDATLGYRLTNKLSLVSLLRYTQESLVLSRAKTDDFFISYGLQLNF